ncbi:hypothetical protein F511_39132 [Dorcoceras hygrometricum]|uniref:Uncharacterized protein n=1 Tax=Dorcoceras hygrometricum TaxID=472368 RepID=A0A2Z7C9F1_9LAMI|nr:hypothetical protein F511_39132 [Dorcoceras hygrometricum]
MREGAATGRRNTVQHLRKAAATSARHCASSARPLAHKRAGRDPSLGSDTTVGEPWRIRITPTGEAAEEQNLGRDTINTIQNQSCYGPFIGCFSGLPFWRLGAWLRPVSRGNRHFTVGGGRLRQSGPRPKGRLLRQPALEGLTRSARTNFPRQVGRNKFQRSKAAAAATAAFGSRTPQNPPQVLNTLSSVSVRESRIQYLCDPQWFRDTASCGPTTIVAPESQFRTCPSDHGKSV